MRARTALLLALAAFGVGFLAGRFASPEADQPRRAPPPGMAADPQPAVERPARAEGAPATSPESLAMPDARGRERDDAPGVEQPLVPGADFASWNGVEFARWYAIHKEAWDLPDCGHDDLVRLGRYLLTLDRIPPRDQLVRLLRAFLAWEADVRRVDEENGAWLEANPGVAQDDPGHERCRERLQDVHRKFTDVLYRMLPYPDYLVLVDHLENYTPELPRRPPASAADAYARSMTIVRSRRLFVTWYQGYAPLLGLPERDEDFLDAFHRFIVQPLGRLPDPALMRTLEDVYAPLHARLTGGEEWEDAVGKLFAALDRGLPLLDYERIRYSHEWERYPGLVPAPTKR